AAEDGPPRPGGLVGAESVVGVDLGPAPRARLGRGGLHPSPPAQTDWPGAGCCGVAPTRRHWVILPSWITKLVSAFSPTPPAQLPGPGRSVSSKVAVVNLPAVSARTSRAPHGSDWLKALARERLVILIKTGPFSATLGIAK